MAIRTEMFQVDHIPTELVPQIASAYRDAFPSINSDGVGEDGTEWEFAQYRILAWEDDNWAAIAGVLVRSIMVGGKEVKVGGVGGVMTLPEFRGKGLASAVMRHVGDVICHELRADAGMLYCAPALLPFYGGLGWYELQRQVHFQQSNREGVMDTRGRKDGCAMFRPCGGFVFPSGSINIQGKLW